MIEATPDAGTPESAEGADRAGLGGSDGSDGGASSPPAPPSRPGPGPRRLRSFLIGLVIAAVLAVALFVGLRPKSGSGSESGPVVGIGTTAPDFTLPSLTSGAMVSLDSLGKAPPSGGAQFLRLVVRTLPPGDPAPGPDGRSRAGQGLQRSSSSGSTPSIRSPSAIPFVQKAGIIYPVVTDDGRVSSGLYGVYGDPQTFFVDADGQGHRPCHRRAQGGGCSPSGCTA